MPRTKGKLPPQRSDTTPISYRIVSVREPAADGAIPVVLATEDSVRTWDEAHRQVMGEVLVMSGAEVPKQVPLVNSHDRHDVRQVFGSIRNLRVVGEQLLGDAYFASDAESQRVRGLVAEGHITDASIGAERLAVKYVERGESYSHQGKAYKGPTRLVTRWRPLEGSTVALGADPKAKFSPALRAYVDPEGLRREAMNEEFRNWLIERGMDKELDDAAALKWASENLTKAERAKAPIEDVTERVKSGEPLDVEAASDKIAERALEKINAANAAERAKREATDSKIRSLATRAGVSDSFADGLIRSNATLEDAAEKILAQQETERQASGYIHASGPGRAESFRKAMLEGVAARATAAPWTPPQGCENFRQMRLFDIARRCLQEADYSANLRGLSDREIVTRSFAMPVTTRASDGQAFHTTGNFANLLLDATNKTLLRGFENTASTYQVWARNAGTVKDFKDIHRVRMGELGYLPMVAENGDYKDLSLSDAKETYRVNKHGGIVSLTWETIVNDDLNAFSRMIQLEGAAAKKTINKTVYDVLFNNPTMSDGVALFHSSSHGANLVTTDFAAAALDTAYAAMMLQTGINSQTILGITPKYLLHSVNDSSKVNILLNSISDVVASAANSGTVNPYGPTGMRRLVPIMEPLIDGWDNDGWFLTADSNEYDTIEYIHLEGEETPVFEQETAFIQDAVKYKVRQTFGVGVIDYRGLYCSTGSG